MNRLFVIGAATMGLFIGACASTPDTTDVPLSPIVDGTAGVEAQSPLIARDLVNTLSQIQQLTPSNTTLRIVAQTLNEDPFTRSLKISLENAGYAIRTTEINAAAATAIDLPVSYTVAKQANTELQDQSDRTNTLMYTVAVGDISIRRIYRIFADNTVQPIAAMQIRGADARNIRSDDTIFQLPATQNDEKPDIMAANAPAQESVQAPVQESEQLSAQNLTQQPALASAPQTLQESAQLSAPDSSRNSAVPADTSALFATREVTEDLASNANAPLINIVAPSLASSLPRTSEFGSVAELSTAPTQNIRDLGESNFSTVFNQLAIVSETILTFENDSTRLGQHNKSRVQQSVRRFEPTTDIFSVIGCSNGATSLAIGQKGLALGRAERVRQELLYAGVPDSNILDEGCWAEEAFDERMPRRGVVLTLKRKG